MAVIAISAADLFSFSGRIGRARFWALNGLCALSLLPAYLALLLSINHSDMTAFVMVVFGVFVTLTAMAAFLAVGVRRLHDRGKTGFWTVLYYPALLIVATCEYDGDGRMIIAIAVVVAVWAVIDLGIQPGNYEAALPRRSN